MDEAVTVEERIREALLEHGDVVREYFDGFSYLKRCRSCGVDVGLGWPSNIAAHQTSVLARIVREAQAEAWDACAVGYVEQLANITLDWEELSNPYRGEGA
jgi:hypothetical protein